MRPDVAQPEKKIKAKVKTMPKIKKPRAPRINPKIVELEDKLEHVNAAKLFIMIIALLACFFLILFGIASRASIDKIEYYEGEIDKYCAMMDYGPMYKDNGVLYCSGTSERERNQSVLEGVATMADAMYGAEKALKYDVRQYVVDKTQCIAANVSVTVSIPNQIIKVKC